MGEDGSGGIERSELKAREWWVKAAEEGDKNAMVCIDVQKKKELKF